MRRFVLLTALLFITAAATDVQAQTSDSLAAFLAPIDSATVRAHLEFLSSDRLEGRAPGTPGESLAVDYIAEQMKASGLVGAASDGSFFQPVPLLGATPKPQQPLTFTGNGDTLRLQFIDDYIASTDLEASDVQTEGDLVFVGYGIEAPAFDWDDYAGMDVRGKILVMLVNDPPATGDEPALFQGDTLTYYGRWTYKYEEARRRGAKGALLIHTDEMAGYPFTVLSGSAAGEQIRLATPPENPLELSGWITRTSAERLAEMAGTTLDAWLDTARQRDFTPQPLAVTASAAIDYDVRRFSGTNVLGKVPGAASPEEAVVYTAHHDHMGIGVPDATGDAIYNGSLDNASGVAMLLTLAKAFGQAEAPPARTVLFASVTAEESGLLGAEHYVRHPAIPMDQTIANINMDFANVFGETDDIVGMGAEKSEMADLLGDAAAQEALTVTPDPRPNQGLFFRSDQLAFARMGVPAVFLGTGRTFKGQPESYYNDVVGRYNQERYHQPSDEFDPAWPMSGLLQQMRVAARLGYRLAYTDVRPRWNEGEAFAARRGE